MLYDILNYKKMELEEGVIDLVCEIKKKCIENDANQIQAMYLNFFSSFWIKPVIINNNQIIQKNWAYGFEK